MDSNQFAEQMFETFTPKPPPTSDTSIVEDRHVTRVCWVRTDAAGVPNYVIELPDVVVQLVQYGLDRGGKTINGLTWFQKMQEIHPDWGPDTLMPLFSCGRHGTSIIHTDRAVQPKDQFIIEFAVENPNNDDTEFLTFSEKYILNAIKGFVLLEKGAS